MPSSEPKNVWPWLVLGVVALYWLAIFVATHLPPADLPGPVSHRDKLAHFVAYGGLAFLLTLATLLLKGFRWRYLLYVFGGVALYGLLDELTQLLVGRTADVKDWLADIAGALAGILAALLLSRFAFRKLIER